MNLYIPRGYFCEREYNDLDTIVSRSESLTITTSEHSLISMYRFSY